MLLTDRLRPLLFVALMPLAGSVGDPIEVDFASLSDFDYVEGMTLPEHVTKLDKQRVVVSGFMRRECQGTGPVDFFMLINDACGCAGMPFMNEIVFCAMPEGQTTEILPGTVAITGTLYVGELREFGIVTSIYRLDVETIED
ncbi:MAG: DUF3299 domain-containing protein [Planctomycetes bacterium]|nr:DUF3299 domain-containing protein [Planctomycetota bacterium]